jgi:AraC-like DNA-binding protein
MLSLAGHLATVFAVIHGVLAIALFVHAMIAAHKDLAADLVESRRRFRHLFVAAVALLGIGIAMVELSAPGAQLPSSLETLAAWGVLAVVAGLAWPLLSIESKYILPTAVGPAVTTVESDQSADHALLERVRASMTDDRLYRQTGLSIRDLADKLRVPEHRLRRAINRGLGERNFNTFINHYRLTEVSEALSDPGQARLPILTIALESGFGSLAPFNRAFRERYGVTPSEYRERALRQQERPTNLLDSRKT